MTTTALKDRAPLGDLDVEAIRLPLETELCAMLERDVEVQRAKGEIPPPDIARLRRDLLGNGLMLTEEMAPDVHGIARDVQRVLGFDKPFEIFQITGYGTGGLNVGVNYTARDPIIIILIGRVIAEEGPDGVAAALGHEFGHYLAHGPSSPLTIGSKVTWFVVQTTRREGLRHMALSYSMAVELTADRIGLLATQDIDSLIGDMMTLASGLPAASIKGGPKAYFEQCRSLVEGLIERGESVPSGTHPELAIRVYAAWLFSESDVYAKTTGNGRGERTLAEINATLAKLLLPGYQVGTTTRTVRFGRRQQAFGVGGPGAPTRPVKTVVVGGDPWDDARETAGTVIGGASKVIKNASTAITPGISRLKKATAQGMARIVGRPVQRSVDEPEDPTAGVSDAELGLDPDAELLDRFAELERRMKGADGSTSGDDDD